MMIALTTIAALIIFIACATSSDILIFLTGTILTFIVGMYKG